MNNIREKIIRLAYVNPNLRKSLIPLLKYGESSNTFVDFLEQQGDKKVKNPDTGNQVKLKSLKGPKGQKIQQEMFHAWKGKDSKSEEDTSSGDSKKGKYTKTDVAYDTSKPIDKPKIKKLLSKLKIELEDGKLKAEDSAKLMDMTGADLICKDSKSTVKFYAGSEDTLCVCISHPYVETTKFDDGEEVSNWIRKIRRTAM